MSSSNVSRSERMLKNIGDKLGLTEPGRQWLMGAVDPFHDTPLNITGLPDLQTGNSVVQTIRQSISISCPTGITSGTYDAYIYMLPWLSNSDQPRQFVQAEFQLSMNTVVTQNGLNGRRVDPITILTGPTDTVVSSGWSDPFQTGATASTTQNYNSLNLPENYTDGDYRILSQGFEVINTTPELNQSGLATCWRSPVANFNTKYTYNHFLVKDPGPTAILYGQVASSALMVERPPNSITQANLLPNTKQWKAKDGCYVVGRFNDLENITQDHGCVCPIIGYTNNENTARLPVAVPIPYEWVDNAVYPGSTLPRPFMQRYTSWSGMDISGCFFTGLDLKSSFTVTWQIVIERFPSFQQPDLIVLAKPTPPYDCVAMEMYKTMVQDLPVGVPQYENGLGDWFRDAISTVAETVSPVLSVIPHPYAQAAAGVAKAFIKKDAPSNYNPHPGKEVNKIEHQVKKEKKEIKKLKKSVMPQKKKAGKK